MARFIWFSGRWPTATGTQCGFCTPGFVMALFAYHHTGEPGDDEVIHDVLAGNLCRCTGYRPIVDAARIVGGGPSDRFADMEKDLVARLEGLAPSADLSMAGAGLLRAPQRWKTWRRCVTSIATRISGPAGTDLGLLASKERQAAGDGHLPSRVCPSFGASSETDTHLEIGAGGDLHGGAAADRQALSRDGGSDPAHRARARSATWGTIGGNVGNASPIGDTPALFDRARRDRGASLGARAPRAADRGLFRRLSQDGAFGR